jgi:hypothetical protein
MRRRRRTTPIHYVLEGHGGQAQPNACRHDNQRQRVWPERNKACEINRLELPSAYMELSGLWRFRQAAHVIK